MPPTWLTIVAWCSITVSVALALAIALDIVVGRHRQHMAVMNLVWPITALYAGIGALLAYGRWGRAARRGQRAGGDERPFAATTTIGVTHCGAGCALGDIVGAVIVAGFGLQIAGLALFPEYAVEFTIAYALGLAFQYFAIAPMRGFDLRKGIAAAAKADTLSLVAFEVGMFGWMAIAQLLIFSPHHLHPSEPVYWLSMQVAMLLGFATAFPVNWWLIRRGIKEAM